MVDKDENMGQQILTGLFLLLGYLFMFFFGFGWLIKLARSIGWLEVE